MPLTNLPGITSTQSANYSLTAGDEVVEFNCTSGNLIATIPSAALVAPTKRFALYKTDTTSNTLTINTTGGQNINQRSSGDIVLGRQYDRLIIASDGNNWVIISKTETKVFLAANQVAYTSDQFWPVATTSVTLGPGRWKVQMTCAVNDGTGTGIALLSNTGMYAADGAGNASTPALLSTLPNIKQIDGETDFSNSNTTYAVGGGTSTANSRQTGGVIEATLTIQGGTAQIFGAAKIGLSTSGSASFNVHLRAERLD